MLEMPYIGVVAAILFANCVRGVVSQIIADCASEDYNRWLDELELRLAS